MPAVPAVITAVNNDYQGTTLLNGKIITLANGSQLGSMKTLQKTWTGDQTDVIFNKQASIHYACT